MSGGILLHLLKSKSDMGVSNNGQNINIAAWCSFHKNIPDQPTIQSPYTTTPKQ